MALHPHPARRRILRTRLHFQGTHALVIDAVEILALEATNDNDLQNCNCGSHCFLTRCHVGSACAPWRAAEAKSLARRSTQRRWTFPADEPNRFSKLGWHAESSWTFCWAVAGCRDSGDPAQHLPTPQTDPKLLFQTPHPNSCCCKPNLRQPLHFDSLCMERKRQVSCRNVLTSLSVPRNPLSSLVRRSWV